MNEEGKSFSELLSDNEWLDSMVDDLVEEYVQNAGMSLDADSLPYVRVVAKTIAKGNFDAIYQHGESEIERIFLKALALCFLHARPRALHVLGPAVDVLKSVAAFRERTQLARS